MKVAAAPISWGVSEVAEWGHQMPPERVLSEMHELGLGATELGPPGYLPASAHDRRELLDASGLRLCAGFVAAVMHDARRSPMAEVTAAAMTLSESGAEVLVLAAAFDSEGYERSEALSPAEWTRLGEMLGEASDVAESHGLDLAVHVHAGTALSTRRDLETLLETTRVDLCLDTGHMFLGGIDPVAMASEAASRVRHVHLKDVDAKVERRYHAGELTYAEAVKGGLYRPLGEGDIDIGEVVDRLRAKGYKGWFVLEQDTALTAEPPPGQGPIADARRSLEYFARITGAVQITSASKEE
jgi:inosose dehydratase